MSKKPLSISAMLDSEEDFTEAYQSYQPRIYRFLFWRTHDEQLSEDLTSSVFVKAWRGRGGFDGGSVQAWLYRIARNVLTDHWRRKQAVSLEHAEELADEHSRTVAERLDIEQEIGTLRSALSRLPHETQELVRLRFIEGLSARETGQRLGMSEGSVRVAQYRALQRIRKLLS